MSGFTFKIASPCTQSWASMNGDERVRHCGACQKNVFNFKEMTRTEIEVLLLKTEGRVCARLYQRKDGTVLTRDCPVALAAVRKKLVAGLMVAAAMLLGVFTFLQKARLGQGTVPSLEPVTIRAVALEENLRGKPVIGPIIERIDPRHEVVMGKMPAHVPSTKVTK